MYHIYVTMFYLFTEYNNDKLKNKFKNKFVYRFFHSFIRIISQTVVVTANIEFSVEHTCTEFEFLPTFFLCKFRDS